MKRMKINSIDLLVVILWLAKAVVCSNSSAKMFAHKNLVQSNAMGYKRVCVYPNWAALRDSDTARLLPESIDPFICTHIHFAYANIDMRSLQLIPSQKEDVSSGLHGQVLF